MCIIVKVFEFPTAVYNIAMPTLQGMNDMENATKFYKQVLHQDNMNIEAIACIATHYFYTDQPEIALKFYRFVVKPRRVHDALCFGKNVLLP